MTLTDSAIEVDGEKMTIAGHTLVLTARHPQNLEKAIGYLDVDPAAAFPGLGRKLPHYGKYSYLGFEGAEPVNMLKGQWQQTDSPLRVDVRGQTAGLATGAAAAGGALQQLAPLPADRRRALAELSPAFSQKALTDHVAFLANPARQGRAPGSDGHEAIAKYITDRFKAYGLAPGGDNGGYFQSFSMPVGERRETRTVASVVGIIPGTKPEWEGQSVLVTAHHDHLGLGWPDVHKGDEGRVHPGADDNASGVAVMLELAYTAARAEKPSRSLVFVAFTGEEAGLLGSAFYIEHAGAAAGQVAGGPPSPPSARPPSPPSAASAPKQGAGRRASLGTVPDFAFEGPGVRVGGLVDGSPAQRTGIREGDVITAIDGKPVANLQAFSAMLGAFAPGQTVKATIVRAGKELTLTVTLVER
jgi:hypothetical protein